MLNAHSRLRVPHETHFLRPLLARFPLQGILNREQIIEAREIVKHEGWWRRWKCPEETLDQCLDGQQPMDLATLISRVYVGTSGMEEHARWGDKTPIYALDIPQLAIVFPQAKFIHLIRDARDVVISIRNAGWLDRDLRRICQMWSGFTRDAVTHGRPMGDSKYLEVRYEDLVDDTERELRRICAFLGEEFDPGMLESHISQSKEISILKKEFHSKLNRVPSVCDKARWKKEMHPLEVAVVESHTGQVMTLVGQKPSSCLPWTLLGHMRASASTLCCELRIWEEKIKNRLLGKKAQ